MLIITANFMVAAEDVTELFSLTSAWDGREKSDSDDFFSTLDSSQTTPIQKIK